jgi:hypothetical protein
MGRTLLIAALTVALLGCSPSSDPSPAAVGANGEHSQVPNMIGDPFDIALHRLVRSGMCVDRIEVLPPSMTNDPSRLTPGLILGQQPGPVSQGAFPYRISIMTFGGERVRKAVQPGRGGCPDPVVVRPDSRPATWWTGNEDDRAGLMEALIPQDGSETVENN